MDKTPEEQAEYSFIAKLSFDYELCCLVAEKLNLEARGVKPKEICTTSGEQC